MESRPPRNKRSNWIRYGVVVLVVSAVVGPAAAYAGDTYSDVPNTNIFHNDIDWMYENGITLGCNGPNFCPKAAVTREQMSAFMHRLAISRVVNAATATMASTATNATLLAGKGPNSYSNPVFGSASTVVGPGYFDAIPMVTVTFTAPANGYVALSYFASVAYWTTDTAAAIGVGEDDPTCLNADFWAYTSVSAAPGSDYGTAAGSVVLPVATGTHTYYLCGARDYGDVDLLSANLQGVFSTVGTTNVAALASVAGSAQPFDR